MAPIHCPVHRFPHGRYGELWKFRFGKPEFLKLSLGLFIHYISLGRQPQEVAATLPQGMHQPQVTYGSDMDDIKKLTPAWNGRWYLISRVTRTREGKVKRETKDGFWQNKGSNKFRFRRGNHKKSIGTKWVMHEYYYHDNLVAEYVIWEIYETKNDTKRKHAHGGTTQVPTFLQVGCLTKKLKHKHELEEAENHAKEASCSERRLDNVPSSKGSTNSTNELLKEPIQHPIPSLEIIQDEDWWKEFLEKLDGPGDA